MGQEAGGLIGEERRDAKDNLVEGDGKDRHKWEGVRGRTERMYIVEEGRRGHIVDERNKGEGEGGGERRVARC